MPPKAKGKAKAKAEAKAAAEIKGDESAKADAKATRTKAVAGATAAKAPDAAAAKAETVADKAPVRIPSHLEKLLWDPDGQELKWIVLKVDLRIDWKTALTSCRLRLGPKPALAPDSASANGDETELPYMAVHGDVGNERLHLLPLKPMGAEKRHHLAPVAFADEVLRISWCWTESPSFKAAPSAKDTFIKLKSGELASGTTMPVAYWNLGPPRFGQAGLDALTFRSRETAPAGEKSRRVLFGKFADSPKLMLIGKKARRPKVEINNTMQPGFRYLVGAMSPGSKKLELFEADLWLINRDPDLEDSIAKADAAAQEDGATEYKKRRLEVVAGYGTAAKKRMVDTSGSREISKTQSQEAMAAVRTDKLLEKAQSHKQTGVDEQELENMRKVLPEFDKDAKEARDIFAPGLDMIAPKHLMDSEEDMAKFHRERGLEEVLMAAPAAVAGSSEADLTHSTGCALGCSVLRARAAGDLREPDKDAAWDLCRKFAVLHNLVRIWKVCSPHGRATAPGLAQTLDMPKSSQLVRYWYRTFFETREGGAGSLNFQKLICYTLVWALSLSPNYHLDLGPMWNQREMFRDLEAMKGVLYLAGCTVETQTDQHSGTLSHIMVKLKAPLQPGGGQMKGKGKGRGRKRM